MNVNAYTLANIRERKGERKREKERHCCCFMHRLQINVVFSVAHRLECSFRLSWMHTQIPIRFVWFRNEILFSSVKCKTRVRCWIYVDTLRCLALRVMLMECVRSTTYTEALSHSLSRATYSTRIINFMPISKPINATMHVSMVLHSILVKWLSRNI